MKSAILYARVSTDEQKEKGTSLETELEACQKYAQYHDMRIVAEFADDYTGTEDRRPELETLMSMLENKKADAVIVKDATRWARANIVFALLLKRFKRA